MQIKNILTFAMAGLAAAAPMNLDQISKSMNAIIDSLKVLDTAVTGLTEASANFPDLVAKSDAVLKTITQGTTDVGATSSVSLTEALTVNSLSTTLINTGSKVVNDFIAKKDVIVKAGKGKEVHSAMVAQSAASDKFGAALKTKLPAVAGSLVDKATKDIKDSLTVSSLLYLPRR